MRRLPCLLVFALALGPPIAHGGRVVLDTKEVELERVLALLVAQGGPRVVAAPDVAERPITFAVKTDAGSRALRWLCRHSGLVAAPGANGPLTLGRPAIDKPIVKDYKVTRLAETEKAQEALLDFITHVCFAAHRLQGGDAAAAEAKLEKGRLKVRAPIPVQREILALLRAAAETGERHANEVLRVVYASHETGLFLPRGSARPPKLTGKVTLDVTDETADAATWALTSASTASFFIDPWDKALRERHISLEADGTALADVVKQLETQLDARRVWYDGAWVLVREQRLPLFDGTLVRAYYAPSAFRPWAEQRLRRLAGAAGQRSGLPYAAERVGDRILASMPPDVHESFEAFRERRDEEGDNDGPRPRHDRRPKGGARKGRPGKR